MGDALDRLWRVVILENDPARSQFVHGRLKVRHLEARYGALGCASERGWIYLEVCPATAFEAGTGLILATSVRPSTSLKNSIAFALSRTAIVGRQVESANIALDLRTVVLRRRLFADSCSSV